MRNILRLFKSFSPEQSEQPTKLSDHPYILPVSLFIVGFFVTAVTFVAVGGHTVGPSDSRVVRLFVDGNSQVLPTRATTVGDLLKRLDIKVGEHDVIEPAIDAPITDDEFNVNIYRAHPVTIVDEGKRAVMTYSAQQAPKEIVKQAGVTVYPEDKVEIKPPEDMLKEGIIGPKVVIDRATPTHVNLYGNPLPVRTHAKTVGEVLAEKDIKPLEGDTITPAPETPITAETQIFVVRVGKQIDTKEEEIPVPVQTVEDASLTLGSTKVQQPGTPGKKLVTYEIELRNGKEISRKPLQEVVAAEPIAKVVVKGTKAPVVIAGDKAAILTAAGVPASQQAAADFVISRESGWRLGARNSSGCLGLGQACPGSKLIAACPNWDTDAICQIQFFTRYANGRYGSWQGAMQAWQIKHWW